MSTCPTRRRSRLIAIPNLRVQDVRKGFVAQGVDIPCHSFVSFGKAVYKLGHGREDMEGCSAGGVMFHMFVSFDDLFPKLP